MIRQLHVFYNVIYRGGGFGFARTTVDMTDEDAAQEELSLNQIVRLEKLCLERVLEAGMPGQQVVIQSWAWLRS